MNTTAPQNILLLFATRVFRAANFDLADPDPDDQ